MVSKNIYVVPPEYSKRLHRDLTLIFTTQTRAFRYTVTALT